MKALSLIIWVSWGAIIARVLLAPTMGLTLNQALVLLLIAAPAVGILCWLRWLFGNAVGRAARESRSMDAESMDDAAQWPGVVGQLF
jgi:hypothetical protein